MRSSLAHLLAVEHSLSEFRSLVQALAALVPVFS